MKYLRKEEGFRGERLFVVPKGVIGGLAPYPIHRDLMVTDAGYYPRAAGHQKSRTEPISEGILLLCVEGGGFVRCRDETHIMGGGTCFFIPPGIPHLYGSSDHDPWSLYWCHLRGDALDDYAAPVRRFFAPVTLSDETRENAVVLFEMLLDGMAGGYSQSMMLHAGRLAAAILTTLFHVNGSFHPDLTGAGIRQVDKVVEEMARRSFSGDSFDLKAMARWAGLSVPHLTVLFKKRFGYTPVEYFSRLRIQQSCRLLEFTGDSVGDVARSVGYADQYYFSRVFKKFMGTSPANFRKGAQGVLHER